jgi:hypothetical protein
MSDETQPFSESDLDSRIYRERLLRKLNTLIAVLEVATAKVQQAIVGPGADLEKLRRIDRNLRDTLDICMRARAALESRERMSAKLSADLGRVNPELAASARELDTESGRSARARRGVGVEMSSPDELRRFHALGRIPPDMVKGCDLDALARRLTS